MNLFNKNKSIALAFAAFVFSAISLFLGSFHASSIGFIIAGCLSLFFQILVILICLLSIDESRYRIETRSASSKRLISSESYHGDDIESQPNHESECVLSPRQQLSPSEAGPKVLPFAAIQEKEEDHAPAGSLREKNKRMETEPTLPASRSNSEAQNLANEAKKAANSAGGTWGIFHGRDLSVAIDGDHTTAVRSRRNSCTSQQPLSSSEKAKIKSKTYKKRMSALLDALKEQNIVETPIMKGIRILREIIANTDESDTLAVAVEEVVKILQDSDNLHSVSMGLKNNNLLGETTKQWLKATVEETQHVYRISSNDRWKKLRLISKKIGLKQLLENNRRMMCNNIRLTFNQGKPDSEFKLQMHTSKWVHEQAEKPARNLKRLGTQELIVGENGEEDHMLISVFSHPHFSLEQMVEIEAYFTEKDILNWNFSVLDLESKSDGNALWFVGMVLFGYHDIITNFHIPPATLSSFLLECQRTYCFDPNPEKRNIYHNSTHAADVALTVGQFLESPIVGEVLTGLQAFALIAGAICHDYRHPGLNNAYLIKTQDNMAVTYNDSSVLENFHCAEATRLMAKDEFNILNGLDKETAKGFRSSFIKVILATDLAHAFEYINKFNAALEKEMKEDGSGFSKENSESQLLLMQFCIKCADICHPARPWDLHVKWSNLIADEFFAQGDREKEEGLPISPLCNRQQVKLAKGQCDFIDFLVRPCLKPFSDFCNTSEWMDHLNTNYNRWEMQFKDPTESRKESLIQVWENNPKSGRKSSVFRKKSTGTLGSVGRKTSTGTVGRKGSASRRRDSSMASVFRQASRSSSKVATVEPFQPDGNKTKRGSIISMMLERRSSVKVIQKNK